jgi:hypothetical protein
VAWKLSGELIETCSCNMLCPCWFGVPELMSMDRGWCDSALLFRIHSGQSDGVDLGGRSVVLAVDFPGPTLFNGNGTARIHVDDRARADQKRELEAIFQGKKGGPMAIIGGLVTKWLPTESSGIDVREDGDSLVATVDGAREIRSKLLRDEAGHIMALQNSGFASVLQFDNLTFQLSPSSTHWSDTGLPRSFETKSGARASWSWSA